MAFTFGAATGDDVNWTTPSNNWNNRPSTQLMCGWFYPTTLTATRCLFAFGTVSRIAIDTTTSELRLTKDNNTTDDVKRTTTLGLAVNNWYFLAFLLNSSSSAAGEWTVWKGTADTPPEEHALTNVTTGSGNNLSSTALCIGNSGSAGTLAFQGDIEDVWCIHGGISTVPAVNYLGVAADGVTAADEKAGVLQRYVQPIWAGDYDRLLQRTHLEPTSTGRGVTDYVPLAGIAGTRRYGYSITHNQVVTINGATPSQNHHPKTAGRDLLFGGFQRSSVGGGYGLWLPHVRKGSRVL